MVQVPSRQTCRSRENVRGSREGLQQDQMTSSHQAKADHAAMFQIEGSQAMPKPEDKFLKEITAKIANRHVGAPGEEGVPGLRDETDPSQASNVDAHMRMRKQKQPADSVHQALVSELRRHLSEGEESAATSVEMSEKNIGKRPVKKPPPLTQQKPSTEAALSSHHHGSPSSSPGPPDVGNKRLKTDSGDREPLLPAPPPPPPHVLSEAEESTSLVSPMEETELHKIKKEFSDVEEELDFSEHSALLRSSGQTSVETGVKGNKQTLLSSEVVGVEVTTRHSMSLSDQSETNMQISSHGLPRVGPSSTKFQQMQTGAKDFGDDDTMLSMTESMEKRAEEMNIKIKTSSTKAQDSFHQEHQAARSESPKSQSPSVAPKPRGKDRHSFPAAHVTSESRSSAWSESPQEAGVLNVMAAGRPKSEMLNTSCKPDSVV